MRPKTPLALAAVAALLLTGCATDDDETGQDPSPASDEAFPVTVGEVTLEEQPTRIVSLSPAVTEILFAVGAGDQVVAADEFSTYPAEAPTTELSGFTPNVEAITTYDPDLVLISFNPDDIAEQLDTVGIPVHLVPDDASTVAEVYSQINDLGALTGHAGEAAELVQSMTDDIDSLVAEAPERDEPLTYYFEIDPERFTYTSDTWVGELFGMVGLENIADDPEAFTTKLSAEAIIDANPDLIFLADTASGESAETVSERDGWSQVEAVRSGQIVELDTDVASRWGPRIVDLLESVIDAVAQVG